MAYEFIASGLRPAAPFKSYMEGVESGQRQRAAEVDIKAGQQLNEANELKLQNARKQVAAEDQWAKLPRSEDGKIDPQSEKQFKTAFPEYYDTRKKAEVAQVRDQIGLAVDQFTMAATLFGKAKSPEDIAKAQAFAKENFDMDIEYDESVFGVVQKYSSELARTSAMIKEDMATAAAAGDWDTFEALKAAAAAEGRLAELEVQKAQSAIARDQAAASASRANASKYAAQAAAASSVGGGVKAPAGMRWKKDGSQEPIPGGPVDMKMKAQRKIEESAKKTVIDTIDREINNIDKLIGSKDGKIKPHKGLDGAVGPVSGRLPSIMPDTTDAEALIVGLQSKASLGGLRDIRSGGSQSIGTITEREWPRLESYKVALQTTQSDGDKGQFVKGLSEYREELERTKRETKMAMKSFYEEQQSIINGAIQEEDDISDLLDKYGQ